MMKKLALIFALLAVIPFTTFGQQEVNPMTKTCAEHEGTGYCIELRDSIGGADGDIKSIRGDTGVDLIGNFVGVMYRYIASVIGIIVVLILVVSGIQMMAGGVSSEAYESAKTRIFQALISLLLLFSSALILKTINPGFFT